MLPDFRIGFFINNVFRSPSTTIFLRAEKIFEEGSGIEVIGKRDDLSFFLKYRNERFILLDQTRLSKLQPFPDIDSSADLVTSALIGETGVVFLTGAMYSGKSEVFNRVVIEAVNENIRQEYFPPPIVVGRAAEARKLDLIIELYDKVGNFVPFNFKITGPLDFLRFVNDSLANTEEGLKLAALEEAGVLLFSRANYLAKVRQNIEEALNAASVPEEFKNAFYQILTRDDSELNFGQELVLMAQVLRAKGIKLLLTGVDRFSSGQPWEPIVQFNALTREKGKEVLIHRKFSECVGCGKPAVISAVTEGYYWEAVINGVTYRVYPFMEDLTGIVKAVDPYYVPLCAYCNDLIRPEILSSNWPAIDWSIIKPSGFFSPSPERLRSATDPRMCFRKWKISVG